jgi:hypothetical protein
MVHRLRGVRNATQDDKHVHGATLLPTRASSRPKSEREQQTWSDKQGGPLRVSKQRLRTEMCPVTRAPVTKSAMTRNMGKSIVEMILTDRRRKSSRENQRMGLGWKHAITVQYEEVKSSFQTTPSPATCHLSIKAAARIGHAPLMSRSRSRLLSKPSDQAPITLKHINRSAGRSHHRAPVSGRPDDLHADTRTAETRGVQAVFELNVTFAFSRFL